MSAVLRILASMVALVVAGAASAETYPSRPVRIIVGFPAGGPTDAIARIIGQKLSERLDQQFYVENVPGAGSNTANGMAAKAAPDGYTLLVVSTGFVVNPSLYAKVPYDPVKDFSPITLVAASPNVLVVNPSVAAKSVQEFIALIRANPGKYSFAGPGIGSTPHLSGELFRLRFNLDYIHVPFTGAAPAIQSTVAGHTPSAFTAVPPAIGNIRDGNLRPLAVTAGARLDVLPDVPTMAEAGVPDEEADTLTGLLAPAGTPAEIINRLHREVARIVALRDVKERLQSFGFVPIANAPAEFGVRIKAEMDKWGKVVRDAKLRVE
jgi:tripartite-type tricarboxylate transporter receptor subunit TctC